MFEQYDDKLFISLFMFDKVFLQSCMGVDSSGSQY